MIYLYAIVEAASAAAEGVGLQDEPLVCISVGDVAGVCSEHASTTFPAEPEALWRHDEVVERQMARGPVLPVRFGTTFEHERALAARLSEAGSGLHAQLERVRGHVELAVRVGLPEAAEDRPPGGGREYLKARLASRRERSALAQRTLDPLADIAASERRRSREERGEISASYLIPADEVRRFSERVRLIQQQNPDVSMSCTGPWAPYSFVDAEVPG